MIVYRVIKLLKCIKAFGQVRSNSGRIIIAQRALIEVEIMFIIVRKVSNLLGKVKIIFEVSKLLRHTLGLLIAALEPPNLFIGCISNLFIVDLTYTT